MLRQNVTTKYNFLSQDTDNALSKMLGESEEETFEKSHKNETRANPYKKMTPPSTQNLKTLGLRVFFLICYLTFSFLPNVELRLILEYLIQKFMTL